MPKVLIINCETGEEIIRDMNAEELEQWEKNKAEAEAQLQQGDTNDAGLLDTTN